LNAEFIKEYEARLMLQDVAVVFTQSDAVKLNNLKKFHDQIAQS
jgi:hypothetical protein